jgi:hypothetical protein
VLVTMLYWLWRFRVKRTLGRGRTGRGVKDLPHRSSIQFLDSGVRADGCRCTAGPPAVQCAPQQRRAS